MPVSAFSGYVGVFVVWASLSVFLATSYPAGPEKTSETLILFHIVSSSFVLQIPPDVFEGIAQRAAELVANRAPESPWLTRSQAADYLGVPLSRLEKDKSVPHHRWDGRILYNQEELDSWLRPQ